MEVEKKAQTPPTVETITPRFNWAGIALPLPFAIANRTYLGLLTFIGVVPIIGWLFALGWCIFTGLNAEKWALAHPKNVYRDEQEFRTVMDGWNRAGLVLFIIECVAFLIITFVWIVTMSFMSSLQDNFY